MTSTAPAQFAFVGCFTTEKRRARGTGIHSYRIDPETGAWMALARQPDLANPSFLIVDRGRLYVAHGDLDHVTAFAIAPDGALRPLGRAPTGGVNGVHLALDPSGRFLLVANYASGSVALLPIGPDGVPGGFVQCLDLPGAAGPHRTEQASAHPHQIMFEPSGRFALVPDKGLDRIFVLSLDAERGRLSIATETAMRPGAGPRHLAFHPSLPMAFAVNEIDSTVATCRWDAESGRLTPIHLVSCLPPDFFGASTAAAILVTPCGRFVYASNRGQDGIARFAFDAEAGRLDPLGWTQSGGHDPRFMCLSPDGSRLLVANEQSDMIATLNIDPKSGDLARFGDSLRQASPCTIAFL